MATFLGTECVEEFRHHDIELMQMVIDPETGLVRSVWDAATFDAIREAGRLADIADILEQQVRYLKLMVLDPTLKLTDAKTAVRPV